MTTSSHIELAFCFLQTKTHQVLHLSIILMTDHPNSFLSLPKAQLIYTLWPEASIDWAANRSVAMEQTEPRWLTSDLS